MNPEDATTAERSSAERSSAERLSAKGRVVVVTGMSGAGLTTALKALEDAGFEAVDNLPLRLVPALLRAGPVPGQGLALGVDARTRDFAGDRLVAELRQLRAEHRIAVDLLYIDCDDEELQHRYSATRRRHPLAQDRPIADGIRKERRLLAGLREAADLVIDTGRFEVRAFSRAVAETFAIERHALTVWVQSFSFRNGLPRDADLVFDVRFLRNPHYDAALRPLTGLDAPVGAHVEGDADYAAFFAELTTLLERLLPRYRREGKSYLTIAVGCTGGRHRSVFVAERLGAAIRDLDFRVSVRHRDLEQT